MHKSNHILRRYGRQSQASELVNRAQNWDIQKDHLADGYLEWHAEASKYDRPPNLDLTEDVPYATINAYGWHCKCSCDDIGLKLNSAVGKRELLGLPDRGDTFYNRTLIRFGLLGSAPIRPTFALSLHTLETYRLLRLARPSLSVQAFSHALCDSMSITYTRSFRRKVSDTFDAYLAILRHVEVRLAITLKRDAPNWRIKHSCPACTHRVPNEPSLPYEQLLAIDGNFSLKRYKDAGSIEGPTFSSDYFLPTDTVNVFQNEAVKKRKVPRKKQAHKSKSIPSSSVSLK